MDASADQQQRTGRIDPLDIREFTLRRDSLRRDGRWADLARLLELRGDHVDDVVEAIHCYLAAADIWERDAGDAGRALESLQRVLRLEPDNVVAAAGLKDFFRDNGRHKDLLDLLLAQIDAEEAPHKRGETCLEVGQVYERHLLRGREAVRWYLRAYHDNPFLKEGALAGVQRVFESSQEDPQILAAVQDIYADLEEWGRVADIIGRRAEVADDAQRKADLLCDLAEVRLDRLRSHDEALAAWRKAAGLTPHRPDRILEGLRHLLDDRPGDRTALRALREVYADQYRWGDVLEVLEAERSAAQTPDERAALLLEMAAVEMTRLFRTDRALARLRDALEADPGVAARVVERVEGVLREAPENADARGLLAGAIAQTGDWDRLAAILTDGAALAGRPAQRARYLCEAADAALEHLEDGDRAAALYIHALREAEEAAPEAAGAAVAGLERVLDLRPSHREALTALRDHYTSAERWESLVRILEREAPLARGPRAQAELHYEIGHIQEERLRRRDAAMVHYQKAFKLNPDDIRYIDAGRRIYRRIGKWDMVMRLQDLELQVAPERRAEILLEKAEVLHRRMDNPVGALEAYLDALDADPDHEAALAGAKAVVSGQDAEGRLREHLEQQARRGEAAPLFLRVARLHEMEPADHRAALEAYRRALSLDPHNAAVFQRVEQALFDQGRWRDLADLYEQAAAREADATDEAAWRVKAGRILLDRLGDRPAGVQSLRAALEVDPHRDSVRRDLLRLLEEDRDWPRLAETYRFILENANDLGPTDRKDLLRAWARLCRGPLGDAPAAAVPYGELLRHDQGDGEALEYFRARDGDPRELLAYIEAAVRGRPEAAADRLAEAAALREHRLGDPQGAILCWEDRLRRLPGDPKASDALHRLYRTAGRWGDLVALLLGEAEVVRNDLARADLLRQAARLSVDRLGDRGRAEEIYGRILREHPQDREALAALADLLQEGGRWGPAIDVLARLSRVLPEPEAAEVLMRRARLLQDRMQRPREALADVRRVLAARPDDAHALSTADGLLSAHGDPRELYIVLGRRTRVAGGRDERCALLVRMAELAEGPLRDPACAVEAWRQVLDQTPDDPRALERLDALHRAQGEWHAVAGVLRRRVELAASPGERLLRLVELGDVLRRRLGDLDRARGAFEAVLGERPDHPEAMAALQEILAEREDWHELSEVLERRAAGETDPGEAVTVLRRLASIRERGLGDAEGAVRALDRAREIAPADRDVLTELRRVLGASGQVDRYVASIEVELLGQSEADAIALSLEAARALRDEAGRADAAAAWFERVLARDPGHSGALLALRQLYEGLGRADSLLEVLRALVEQAADDGERLALLDELAALAEEAGRAADALEFHKRAHRLAPGREGSAQAMRRLAAEHGLWDGLLEALQGDVVRAAGREERTALLLESASILDTHVGDRERAFAAYQMAFKLQPGPGPALDGMRRLAERVAEAGAASLDGRLVAALEELLDATADHNARIAVLCEIAAVRQGRMGDVDGAFEALKRAYQLDPEDDAARVRVEDLARRTGAWQPLTALYADLQARVQSVGGRVALHHEVAEVLEREVGSPERAFDEYVAAFRLDPLDESTEAELARLGESLEAWDRLLAVFTEGADIVPEPAARARFLARAARVQEGHAADPGAALQTLLRALRLDPRAEELPEELERLGRRLGRLTEVVATYDALAGEAAPDLELVLRRRAAALLEDALDNRMGAVTQWARIWRLDPDDDRAGRRLSEVYWTQGRWSELLEILGRGIAVAKDPAERVPLLFEVAEIEQKRGAPRKAVEALEHVLSLSPGEDRALEMLEGIHGKLGDPERVVHTMLARAAAADAAGETARATGHRMRGAAWWDGTLGRPDQARSVYRELLAAAPDDAGAAAALEALCRREGWWEELLELLEGRAARAQATGDPEGQADLLLRVAQLAADRFDNRKRATECLERVLELRPDDREAEDRLVDWYHVAGRWSDLLRVLARRLARFRDDRARADLHRLMGAIQETRLFDAEAARASYEAAIALAPDDRGSLEALFRLYRAAERWDDAVRAGRSLVAATGDDNAAAATLFELAAVLLEHVGDEAGALACWREAAERMPARAGELEEVRRRLKVAGRRDLEDALLAVEQAHTTATPRRVALFAEMGRRAVRRGDAAAAVGHFEAALDLDPGNLTSLAALGDLYREQEDWRGLDRILERTVALLEGASDDDIEGRKARLAEAWAGWGKAALRLDQKPKAIERLYKALKADPEARGARKALADLAWHSERWKVAEEHYRALCQRPAPEDDAGDLAGWYGRLATCLERMGHEAFAADAWREALARRPTNLAARRGLASALLETGRWDEAARSLAELLSGPYDLADRRELLIRLGEVLADHCGDPRGGLLRFEEAAALGGEDQALLERLFVAYEAQGDRRKAAQVAEALARMADKPEALLAAHLVRGDAALDEGRWDEAATAFGDALAMDPCHPEAALGLADARERSGDPAAAARALEEHVLALQSEGRAADPGIWGRIAAMRQGRLGDEAGADEALARWTASAPDDPAAWRALAEATADAPDQREAHCRALRAWARLSPGDVAAYRGLLRAFRADGNDEGAAVVADLLVFLKVAGPDEVAVHASAAARGDGEGISALPDAPRLDFVDLPESEGPVEAALHALLEAAPALFAADPGETAEQEEGVEDDTQRALPARFREVSEALGLPGRRLVVRQDGAATIDLQPGRPPALLVGKGLTKGMFRKEQRFFLARTLSLTRGARQVVRALHADDGEALVLALRGADGDRAREWRGLLEELLGRERLEAVGAGLAAAPEATFRAWADAAERSAARAAYVLCGDLGTALQALRREAGGDFRRPLRDPEALAELTARSPVAADLLEYAVSERHVALRRWAARQGASLDGGGERT